MRLLITTQVCPPERHPTAVMVRELAEDLTTLGWEVLIATGRPHYPDGQVPAGFETTYFSPQVEFKTRVTRGWHPVSSRRDITMRALVMATQALSTAVAGALAGRADVVLSFGGPPLLGPILSGFIASAMKSPLVTLVHDLYPAVAIETGSLRQPLLVQGAKSLESLQYRLSTKLISIGPTTAATLRARPENQGKEVVEVPVWLDQHEITPQSEFNSWRERLQLPTDKKIVLHAGTLGLIANSDLLLSLAARMPSDALLVIVGGGAGWKRLNGQVQHERLRLIPFQDRSDLPLVQAVSRVSVVTMRSGHGVNSVPSKVQGYMAAGRPVVAAVDLESDTARLIERGEFGLVVPPDDEQALSSAVASLLQDPEKCQELGMRARKCFEREFSRDACTRNFHEVLSRTVLDWKR